MTRQSEQQMSRRDRIRQRAAQREGGRSRAGQYLKVPEGVEFWKPEKEATHDLDFLLYKVSVDNHPEGIAAGDLWHRRLILVHYEVGPELKAFLCPKTMGENHRCPICEEQARMYRDPDADREVTKKLNAKERELFNVVCLQDKEPTVKLFEISTYLFGEALEKEIREGDESFADFAELSGGSTLKTRWEKASAGKQSWFNCDRIDFKPREDYPETVLDEVIDLDSILVVPTYEELEAAFLGTEPEEVAGKPETGEPVEERDDPPPPPDEIPMDDKPTGRAPLRRRAVAPASETEKPVESAPARRVVSRREAAPAAAAPATSARPVRRAVR